MGTDAPPISRTVAGFALTRLVGNLFIRFPYVFVTQISRGLGVEISTVTAVLGIRELGGLVAPVTGRFVDRGHTARVVGLGGLVAGLSCVAAATSHLGVFVVVMVIGGATKISIDLAQNAWIGHNVPLDGRGRIIGIIEMTWAGAFLVGIPILGWVVDEWGWQAAFIGTGPLLAVAAIASSIGLRESPVDDADDPAIFVEFGGAVDTSAHVEPAPVIAGNRARLKTAVWIFCFLQPLAQMVIFAVNSDWFRVELGMSTGGVSAVNALLGGAELLGTVIAVAFTDRFGPLRCGMWGILLVAPPLLAITTVGHNVPAVLALMFVMDIGIEFAFVAVLPLVSELDVSNRGKAVGQVFVLIMVARAIGSAIAGYVYDLGGFGASIVVSSAACAGAAAALWWARRTPAGAVS